MRNLLLIGQSPSRSGDPDRPLEGRIAIKFAELLGCSMEEYLRKTQRYNVLPFWAGKNGKGDCFPVHIARINAARMRWSFGGCHVLFVGIATARMFDVRHEILKWKRVKITHQHRDAFYAAIIPHPSGVNRWWNDEMNTTRAAMFLRTLWRKHKRR